MRPKIHPPTQRCPIKSRLKSVLGVRSSYVERNNSSGHSPIRSLVIRHMHWLFIGKILSLLFLSSIHYLDDVDALDDVDTDEDVDTELDVE